MTPGRSVYDTKTQASIGQTSTTPTHALAFCGTRVYWLRIGGWHGNTGRRLSDPWDQDYDHTPDTNSHFYYAPGCTSPAGLSCKLQPDSV